jgi:hypothetical protein
LPRRLAEAPVKMTVPRPSGTSRREASRPTRKPPKQPTRLELRGGHFSEVDPLIVPGAVGDKIDRLQARAWRQGHFEQPRDIGFARNIGHDRLGAATCARDCLRDLVDLAAGPPGDEDVISLSGKVSA